MLNFIPQEIKEEIKLRKQKKKIVLFFLLIFLFEISFYLTSLAFYLKTQGEIELVNSLQKITKSQQETKALKEAKEKIISFNRLLSTIINFYQKRTLASESLITLSKSIPQGVRITSISYSQESSSMIIAGVAEKREDLIEFKRNLEKTGHFRKIDFPPSNWVKPENINFLIRLYFNEEK